MSDDDYSPEQKKKLAKHFVLVAPHGEVQALTTDLKKVVKGNLLSDEWVSETMSDYNKRRFVIASGDSSKVIVCPQGEVGKNKFLNPSKKLVCTIDPTTQKITSEESAGDLCVGGDTGKYRDAIDKATQEYIGNFYDDKNSNPTSRATGMASVYASKDNGQIVIVISYKNLNVSNFWTGGWQSEWTTHVSKTGKTSLEGRIRLNVHYYEDGNVQLISTFNEKVDVSIDSSPDKTASNVVKAVEKVENDFQNRLDKFYTQMHDSTFKNMRRFLPKIGKKMDWRASIHKMVDEMNN